MVATGLISDQWLAEVANILKGHLPNPSRSSTSGFPEKAPAITQAFSYTGHLTDMVLISPSIPGVYPHLEDIRAAAAFWYSNARVDATQAHELLPRFVVQAGKKRGNLLRRGNDVRLWAFMHTSRRLWRIKMTTASQSSRRRAPLSTLMSSPPQVMQWLTFLRFGRCC